MTKKFATPVAICDAVMPTWLMWDLLTVASSEQCQETNIQAAAKYRISDGKKAIEIWVITDLEGCYQMASTELMNSLNNFHHHQPLKKQSIVTNQNGADGHKIFNRSALSYSR